MGLSEDSDLKPNFIHFNQTKISLTELKCLFKRYLPSEEENYYAVISTTSLESEYVGSNRVSQMKSRTENHLHVGKGNEESRDRQKFFSKVIHGGKSPKIRTFCRQESFK